MTKKEIIETIKKELEFEDRLYDMSSELSQSKALSEEERQFNKNQIDVHCHTWVVLNQLLKKIESK